MKTSKEWWDEVKADSTKLNEWLVKQYRGEVTAARRIIEFRDLYADQASKEYRTLMIIGDQEGFHASWIADLLRARNIIVPIIAREEAEKRYWKETLPGIDSLETGAGVAAHAEAMRLERIQIIAEDETAPEDIRSVFKMILRDELFHEKAFREMAGDEAMERTKVGHERGRQTLGLVA